MIIRVWGIVNSIEVEFTPIKGKPGYWEGLAPKVSGLQEIEIWAESDSGARGHLECSVQIHYGVDTFARLVLLPFYAEMVEPYRVQCQQQIYLSELQCCRKAVG